MRCPDGDGCGARNGGLFPAFRGRPAAVALAALPQSYPSGDPSGAGSALTATGTGVATGGDCRQSACQRTSSDASVPPASGN
nr:hypothetical protein [Erwinia sorbitola]